MLPATELVQVTASKDRFTYISVHDEVAIVKSLFLEGPQKTFPYATIEYRACKRTAGTAIAELRGADRMKISDHCFIYE